MLSVATLERGSCVLSSGTRPLKRASALSLVLVLEAVLVAINLGHEISLSNTLFFFGLTFWHISSLSSVRNHTKQHNKGSQVEGQDLTPLAATLKWSTAAFLLHKAVKTTYFTKWTLQNEKK